MPGIDQLLVQSAIDPDLCRQLQESPDQLFLRYDLSEEEKNLLRHPDHRLLPLLGAALARQSAAAKSPAPELPAATVAVQNPMPPALHAHTLPHQLLALTVVPCALRENTQLTGIAYAVWVSPIAEGVDPATLPPPAGATLPGPPLNPLFAVIQLSAVQSQDAAGNPQVALSASMRQSTNVFPPPSPQAAGNAPHLAPALPSPAPSAQVAAAVAAVRSAPPDQRYDRLADLLRALCPGDAP